MLKIWFSRISKKARWIIIAIIALFLISFGVFVFSPLSKVEVPPAFSQGREEASKYAEEIVSAANEISANLKGIQTLEGDEKEKQALDIVILQLQKNNESRQKAILLTEQLSKMTSAVPYIHPERAGRAALEALSAETVLVQKLINYNDLLNQLLILIKDSLFEKSIDYDKMNKIIDDINRETEEINGLNEKFLSLINDFDGYFGVSL
ncbi:MAG: hypothetical protein UV58_C0015G0006 [Candidatus Wolfebacteria bacterium GW2011_GWC1_43_10]|uniref:DUF5667 domain-containing protein n=2 Tax=Candidatus Wolfeibacteriota TaxID=1752735 RepID=A0A0G1C8J7_9BACT|nr:MAG: hypothetical protein UV58_C0015G0006 [Candidatus Wolfebacteria bacterium GW2011_GWC1_43_10]KKT23043.1 MAG: hypothetical protein UW08_C0001G0006 [Parcubacteria group bacterium GW2011_GWB1_43_8b]OGM90141.1 MAG: hypothetical protein A2108_02035 [Candidatus Wolfebacteria bacterium GWA1_42_9]